MSHPDKRYRSEEISPIASSNLHQPEKFQSSPWSFHLQITKRPLTLSGLRYPSHPLETLNLLQLNLTNYLQCSQMLWFSSQMFDRRSQDILRCFQMFSGCSQVFTDILQTMFLGVRFKDPLNALQDNIREILAGSESFGEKFIPIKCNHFSRANYI